MTTSQKGIPDKRPASMNTGSRADTSRDEIDLSYYFGIIWRRKFFVIFGAVCPTLLVWLFLSFSPRDYSITYTYDIELNTRAFRALQGWFRNKDSSSIPADKAEKAVLSERAAKVLQDRFYSMENLDKLTAKLRENGFEEYARDISPTKIQLEGSDTLLTVTITSKQAQNVRKISSIVRDDIEKVLPMYSVEEYLNAEVVRLRGAMADFEENKFNLETELEHKKEVSARLKALASTEPDSDMSGLVLHFENVRENSEYLPLSYQVQATDANIIRIEQTIRANQEQYDYYGGVLSLNESFLEEIRSKMSSYYTIGEFRSFLTQLMGSYEGHDLKSYLSAYIKKIENAISVNKPVVETPRICPVPKGGLRKTGIVFVGLLMVTTFGVFLLDAAQKGQELRGVKSS